MKAKNQVIAGEFKGKFISTMDDEVFIIINPFDISKTIYLNSNTVKSYEVVDEEKSKKVTSAVGRATLGFAVAGAPGLLAGVTAKNKSVYTVKIEFVDGKKSLIEIDEKKYRLLLTNVF